MSDLIKQHFRATNGFDAAGGKIINVAKADRTVLDDGVNVEYLIQENTIQPWADDRGYLEGFAITYEKRIWVARNNVAAPVPPAKNTFKQSDWVSMRVDPKWENFTQGDTELPPGTYANANSQSYPVEFKLPANSLAQNGDTICVRDIGGFPGVNQIVVRAQTNQAGIMFRGASLRSLNLSRPYAMLLFTYQNGLWYTTLTDLSNTGRFITPATLDASGTPQNPAKGAQVQASETIIRRYTSNSSITVKLPRYAINGDIIYFSEPEGKTPLYHFTVKTFDANTSIGVVGTTEMTFRNKGGGQLFYDEPSKLWIVDDEDQRQRIKIITDDVSLVPNDVITVFGANNATVKTITVNLPTDVAIGDTVSIGMNYMRKGQTVVIKPKAGDTIASSIELLQFPKRSEYPPDAAWVQSSELRFNGTDNYPPVLELAYVDDGTNRYWIVSENIPTIERVDATAPARVGVIALATSAEVADANTGNLSKEKAVTPGTLIARTATDGRIGLAEIATQGEVNTGTDYTRIVTPKTLNDKQATESMRGVAEIATQGETNADAATAIDTHIVTPKKLANRTSTIDRTGIIQLVKSGGAPTTTSRTAAGTEIYDHADYSKAVTPKTLREYKATEMASGAVWLATPAEVRAGTPNANNIPTVVTPEALHAKVADTNNIGLIQVATQAEVNAGTVTNKAVTPKTLNDRKAAENLSGIAFIASQAEFNTGTDALKIVTPNKVKSYFDKAERVLVRTEAGLAQAGTLWGQLVLNIQVPTETQRGTPKIATQALVNAGADDVDYLTSKKLQAKQSSESASGISRFATQAEVNAGTINNKTVSPVHLKYVIQTSADWRAQDNVRGTVRVANDAAAWTGDDTNGSDGVAKEVNGYAVSPNGLKQALSHYLPIKGKAFDTDKLDGLDSLQFIRRDINQDVNGILTFTKVANFNTDINVSGQINARGADVRIIDTGGTAGNVHTRFLNNDGTERGIIYAKPNSDTLGELTVRVKNKKDGGQEFTFKSTGEFTAPNQVTTGILHANQMINTQDLYRIRNVAVLQLQDTDATISVGNNSKRLKLLSSDANQIFAIDENGAKSYKVLTEKNRAALLDPVYVNKTGDSMSGNLTLNNAALVVNGSESWYSSTTPTAMGRQGSWTVEINDAAKVNSLRGYVVPIREEIDDPNNPGQKIKVVVGYNEKKGKGGLLSQTGVNTNNTYQVWTPYAPDSETTVNAVTHTMWTRIWNPRLNAFDEWMRVFTSATPPTAADIGAPSSVSTQVKTLEVLDWIKLGPVKIYPDRTTQTVKFEWVGD